jgi:hypothetical protein
MVDDKAMQIFHAGGVEAIPLLTTVEPGTPPAVEVKFLEIKSDKTR